MVPIPPDLQGALTAARALDDLDLVDALEARENAVRQAIASRAVIAVVVEERIESLGYPVHGAADQIAISLAVSSRSAEHLLDTAEALVDRPQVWTALAQGRIDLTKAKHILEGLETFKGIPRAEMEADAIEYGANHTPHELKLYLLRQTCDGDPGDILRKQAEDKRGVWLLPAGHGMADISARLSLEHAEIFYQALTKLAKQDDCADPYEQGGERTLSQRRADALLGFLDTITTVAVQIDVAISADALIGDDHREAYLGNRGAIPASLARYLAFSPDARWRRLVCDPLTGCLIDVNAKTYKIPERVKRVVRLRDRTCRFPGCSRPAEYTDTDHIVPWPEGRTRAIDLAGECRRHHLVKTHSAWTVRHRRDVSTHDMIWTSPLGTQRTTFAFQYHRRD